MWVRELQKYVNRAFGRRFGMSFGYSSVGRVASRGRDTLDRFKHTFVKELTPDSNWQLSSKLLVPEYVGGGG